MTESGLTPHVDFEHDPNLRGEGQRIRDLVQMRRLDSVQMMSIASRLDPKALLDDARAAEMSANGKHSVRHGNVDILALIESGVFQFNEQALQEIIKGIHIPHPNLVTQSHQSGKALVDALVETEAVWADSELPDVILQRRDILSNSGDANFLADAIEAGIFNNRPELMQRIVEMIAEQRSQRETMPGFSGENRYWESAMQRIEQPVVSALAELGADVRSLQSATGFTR